MHSCSQPREEIHGNPILLCFVADLKHLQGNQVPPAPRKRRVRGPRTCAGWGTAPTREMGSRSQRLHSGRGPSSPTKGSSWVQAGRCSSGNSRRDGAPRAGRGAHPSADATGSRTWKWTRGAERAAPPRAGLGSGCGREKMQRQMTWEVRLGWERLGAHGFARAVHGVEPRALLLL